MIQLDALRGTFSNPYVVRDLRRRLGLRQSELASLVGSTQVTISTWEQKPCRLRAASKRVWLRILDLWETELRREGIADGSKQSAFATAIARLIDQHTNAPAPPS